MNGYFQDLTSFSSVAFGILFLVLASWPLAAAERTLADPARMLESADKVDFVGANTMGVEGGPFGQCLRSTPHRSASALYQSLNINGQALREVHWTWRVDRLQKTADIRKLSNEDVGATVMFVFGEPSLFNNDVPTLAYVWTATPVINGAVLPSQRFGSLAYVQLRGRADVGQWQKEARDVTSDFRSIFGRDPGPLRYIAVFNDNDQTNEDTSALFGPIVSAK